MLPNSLRLLLSLALASLSFSLLGCEGNALHQARMADTPESYQAFLDDNPDHPEAEWMRDRIEELLFLKAKDQGTSAALRAYLDANPEAKHAEKAATLEDELAWGEAEKVATAEAYKTYVDTHPEGKFAEKASYEQAEKLYMDKVVVENLRVEKVNLANDPEGPLNGWGIYADVKNIGERIVVEVEVVVHYLDDKGQSIETDKWWAVAKGIMGMPTPPYVVPPLPGGEAREFIWTTGEVKEGWARKVRLEITNLRFEDGGPGSVGG